MPSVRPVNTAASPTTAGALSPLDESILHTAETEAGGSTAGVTAPMHGQIEVDPRTGETARRLVMTAPAPSFRSENLGKRSRGGTRTPVSISSSAVKLPVRSRTGRLVKGRADSGDGRRSDSIPSKSRRISDPDTEPVVTSQLSVRRRESAVAVAVQGNDASEGCLMQGVGGGEVDRGAQAVRGQPLVPQPSSPRPQAECHPW